MNVLGIDPSLTATGWARGNETGTISGGEGDERIRNTFDVITRLLSGVRCDLAVIEAPLPSAKGNSLAVVGMVHGVIRLTLMQHAVPFIVVSPSTVKKVITGSGAASKSDIRMAIYKRTGLDIPDDNQADAWVLRQIGLILFNQLDAVKLPAANLTGLSKLNIPAPLEAPAA